MDRATDVVIVGAGLSGLAAARRLASEHVTCLVVEARDRVGGRTFARTVQGLRIDLGGQWIGAKHERLTALAARLGLETFPTYHRGQKVLEMDGRLSR